VGGKKAVGHQSIDDQPPTNVGILSNVRVPKTSCSSKGMVGQKSADGDVLSEGREEHSRILSVPLLLSSGQVHNQLVGLLRSCDQGAHRVRFEA